MRPRVCLPIVGAVLLVATPALRAETEVGGLICEDTIWDLAGSPYIVTPDAGGSIIVGCRATLTIEPGVEVRFEPGLALLVGWGARPWGTLVARGTEESPILFTSNQLDPAPGDWSRVAFFGAASDATFDEDGNYQSGCILERVIVEYAGASDYAAISVDFSKPYLTHCEVRNNLKRGIAVKRAWGLRIENCYIHENHGGGIYFESSSHSTVTGNTVSGNSARDDGGGLYFSYSGFNRLTGNTISGNRASAGGAMCFEYSGSNTLTGNVITNNRAALGAGIYLDSSGENALSGNTISANIAGSGAGGALFYRSPSNTLTRNTISENSAGYEAGGISFDWYSGSNTLTDNTISGNSGYAAGGIHFSLSGWNTLTGNTVSDNGAHYGAGIYLYLSRSNAFVGNTISGNTGSSAAGMYLDSSSENTLIGNTISGNTVYYYGAGIYFDRYSDNNTLTGNTIEENTAGRQAAIYLRESNNIAFLANRIRFNHTSENQTGGVFVTGGSERLSLNGGPEAYNTICCNDGYDVYNDNAFSGDGRYDIDARNVLWGTDDTGAIQAEIYDFFDDSGMAMVLWDPYVWDPPAGDLDGDGCVDHTDLGILLSDWQCTGGDCPGDCDGDGDTDHSDLGILLADWGSECSCQCD